MKILQLIQKKQNRGAETFACQLANHLVKLGNQVLVVAVFDGKAELPFQGEIYSLHGVEKNRFFDLKAWKTLAKFIKDFKPDIIQTNAGDTLKYAVFSKLIFNWEIPIIARNASELGRYLNSILQKKLNSFFYQKISFVVCVSQLSEVDILEHFSFLEGKTTVIPVGLESTFKQEHLILKPLFKKHIVHVGGFTFEKNHLGLLRIFHKILKTDERVHLHLVGDGPLKSKVQEEVRILGLNDYISFYGFVNNPMSYMEAADVMVLPSIIEGLPGVLLEAMYCKTPVVAYDVGGIAEIVSSQTGNLIKKGEEDHFGTAVLECIKDPDDVQISQAYEMVKNNYMNSKISLEFEKIYTKVLT